jgi:hypothetical protein
MLCQKIKSLLLWVNGFWLGRGGRFLIQNETDTVSVAVLLKRG